MPARTRKGPASEASESNRTRISPRPSEPAIAAEEAPKREIGVGRGLLLEVQLGHIADGLERRHLREQLGRGGEARRAQPLRLLPPRPPSPGPERGGPNRDPCRRGGAVKFPVVLATLRSPLSLARREPGRASRPCPMTSSGRGATFEQAPRRCPGRRPARVRRRRCGRRGSRWSGGQRRAVSCGRASRCAAAAWMACSTWASTTLVASSSRRILGSPSSALARATPLALSAREGEAPFADDGLIAAGKCSMNSCAPAVRAADSTSSA